MRRQHSHDTTAAVEQRGGLHGADTSGAQHVERRTVAKQRAVVDVFDTDALAGLHRHPAGGVAFLNRVEELEERAVEAAARHDAQPAGGVVEQLDVAHVGAGDRDGRIDDLEEQRRRIARLDQARADLLELRHGGQIREQARLAVPKRRLDLLAFREVERDPDEPDGPAIVVAAHSPAFPEPARFAVGHPDPEFRLVRGPVRDRGGDPRLDAGPVVGLDEVVERPRLALDGEPEELGRRS